MLSLGISSAIAPFPSEATVVKSSRFAICVRAETHSTRNSADPRNPLSGPLGPVSTSGFQWQSLALSLVTILILLNRYELRELSRDRRMFGSPPKRFVWFTLQCWLIPSDFSVEVRRLLLTGANESYLCGSSH